MARFKTKKTVRKVARKTVNLAGGEAHSETPKLEFASLIVTNMLQDQFYRPTEEALDRLRELMDGIKDKKFLAKALILARSKFNMRSITHVGAAELAGMISGEPWAKKFFDRIVVRVDDMTEIVGYWLNTLGNSHTLTAAMKHGFGNAFGRFNEYHLAKYRAENHDPSLVDVVNMVHPRPVKGEKGNYKALKALVAGKLKSVDTWESKLTKAGQEAETEEEKDELKGAAWKELIADRKLGYFALLRNLRNIAEQAPKELEAALEMLLDEKLIRNSHVLPYRFATAYDQFSGDDAASRKIRKALSKALDIACKNVTEFTTGKTVLFVDVSGSMQSGGEKGAGRKATLFAAILAKANNADIVVFDHAARMVKYDLDQPVLELADELFRGMTGGSTSFHMPFRLITSLKRKYDRIIILSDMQAWMLGRAGYSGCGTWSDSTSYYSFGRESDTNLPEKTLKAYKDATGADPFVYSFDLTGYGTLQFPQSKVLCLAGLSEKVFDVMKALEKDRNAFLTEIESVEL